MQKDKIIESKKIVPMLKCIWSHFSKRRKIQFVLLTFVMLLCALAELISLGAVLPFLAVLISPDKIFNYSFVRVLADYLNITSSSQLALPITVIFILAALGSGAIRLIQLWISTRLTFASGTDMSIAVYRKTLYQPYQVHIARNSSEIISSITNKVSAVIFGVLISVLTIISSTILLVILGVGLFYIDPLVATISFVGFGLCYGLITWRFKKKLGANSLLIAKENTKVIKALQEGLGGIRDVLLEGNQAVYCNIYMEADTLLRKAQGSTVMISGSPRFLIESFGMIIIAVLAYVLSLQSEGIASSLPVMGALALGAQRLLPALQNIFSSWAGITGTYSSLADIVEILEQPIASNLLETNIVPVEFSSYVKFQNIGFKYKQDGEWILNDLNLVIPKGARIGLVGSTGSGKSTTTDLLMGLLVPTQGEILVDDRPLNLGNIRSWQKIIAHVPQNIYLSDSSMTENIAFGIPVNEVDFERVKSAAKQANMLEMIEKMPEGYQTKIGERGSRLSGGQRQRIGIARALYKNAKILVFDEATSALDNSTEQSVMDSINSLGKELTVIIIAHRLTTVRNCHIIYELSHGKVIASGTYEQLLESSASFRHMVQTGYTKVVG
jgi:ABC-type multidrug transport system fused ATPase/permease subunit